MHDRVGYNIMLYNFTMQATEDNCLEAIESERCHELIICNLELIQVLMYLLIIIKIN